LGNRNISLSLFTKELVPGFSDVVMTDTERNTEIEEFILNNYPVANQWDPKVAGNDMFSVRQKREISEAVQKILRATNHPELPEGEINFELHVAGAEPWSYATIHNNGVVMHPEINPWNEMKDPETPWALKKVYFDKVYGE
jgi:hypothetical protein